MSDFTIQIDKNAWKEAEKKLANLDRTVEGNVIKKALSEGEEIIVKEGKENLRQARLRSMMNLISKHGTMGGLKMIGKRHKGSARTALIKTFSTRITPSKYKANAGFRRPEGALAHLYDKGTGKRYTKKGYYRGEMPKTHFWTNANKQKGQEASNKLFNVIEVELKKQWQK